MGGGGGGGGAEIAENKRHVLWRKLMQSPRDLEGGGHIFHHPPELRLVRNIARCHRQPLNSQLSQLEVSSPRSPFCADSHFAARSTPMLPQ